MHYIKQKLFLLILDFVEKELNVSIQVLRQISKQQI